MMFHTDASTSVFATSIVSLCSVARVSFPWKFSVSPELGLKCLLSWCENQGSKRFYFYLSINIIYINYLTNSVLQLIQFDILMWNYIMWKINIFILQYFYFILTVMLHWTLLPSKNYINVHGRWFVSGMLPVSKKNVDW